MPMDGFTLSFMCDELREALLGGRVDKVYQPERDTALLLVRGGNQNLRLLLCVNPSQARVQLTAQSYENPQEPPMFCMLLRKHLTGARLTDIRQLGGDRVLAIDFECADEMGERARKTLVLELMGRHSNLTFTDERGTIIDAIRHVNSDMSRVRTVLPGGAYQLPPAQDKLTPDTLHEAALAERLAQRRGALAKALVASVAGMADVCAAEVCARAGLDASAPCEDMDADAAARKICAFLTDARALRPPVVLYDDAGLALDFFPFPYATFAPEGQKPAPTLSAAMDAFYLGRELRLRMKQRAADTQRHAKTAVERLEKKRGILLETLDESERADRNRIFGELLTANLHLLEKGRESVTLPNYYDEAQASVTIPLSARLTPAQNAQAYFKKYRKARAAAQHASEQLVKTDTALEVLNGALDDLDKCVSYADLGEIRAVLRDAGFLRPEPQRRKQRKLAEGKPFRFVAPDGTEIFVGKNALQNDRLTLHARGDDLWLHAQGVPGSHVLVRGDGEPSQEALFYAAKLAAYFSKGRNHPQQPVDYTRRKHVRKTAGAPAGFVTYTNFKTLAAGLTPEDLASIQREASRER